MRRLSTHIVILMMLAAASSSCFKHSSNGSIEIIPKGDETADAAVLVAEANADLTKIKQLYDDNETKRVELKKAMEASNADAVKKIAASVESLINDGSSFADDAIDKIQKAQEMEINDDYREYLRLKEQSLKLEIDAFENYRQAARILSQSYDPKDTAVREKVTQEFKTRSDNYLKLMEQARDYSHRANDLAKDVARREQE